MVTCRISKCASKYVNTHERSTGRISNLTICIATAIVVYISASAINQLDNYSWSELSWPQPALRRPDCQKLKKKKTALSKTRHPGVNNGINIMISDWSVFLTYDWIAVD